MYLALARVRTFATKQVGFVGLGNMGLGMAKNVQAKLKGASLLCFEASPDRRKQIEGEGLTQAHSLAELKDCKEIVLSLPNGHISQQVCLGKEGLFTFASKGAVIIDTSTIEPDQAKSLSGKARHVGMEYVDCPVSGGVKGAALGTLCFMVGARTNELFQSIKPLLSTMGARIINCQGQGLGQVAKMCNNLAMAIQMIGNSQALATGVHLGMDPKILSQGMNALASKSWCLETYSPIPQIGKALGLPSGNNYSGGFACKLMAKDLKISKMSRKDKGIGLGMAALERYEWLMRSGKEDKDFGCIYQVLKNSQYKLSKQRLEQIQKM